MENFEVLNNIPKGYKDIHIADGCNGRCYRTINGDVYKEFKYPFEYESDIQVLTHIQSPYFAFPRKLVYLREKAQPNLKGYRMDFVDGKPFTYIDKKTSMEALINASKNVERAIYDITKYYQILIHDLHNSNVLFQSNREFRIVDTDLYEYDPSNEFYELMKTNMREWNEYLLYNLECMLNGFTSSLLNLHFEIAMYTGKYKASDILEEIVSEIRMQSKEEVDTLSDYYEGIKLIKRKE